jgi:hypothetical protein
MAICGCGLLSTAVSLLFLAALFMQICGVSLALTWPLRLCLLRDLCTMLLLQAFRFPSTLGEVTLYPLSQACVFVYSSHGKWVFPALLWSFPPSTTLTSFPDPGCWVPATAPTLSGQARLVYLQSQEGFPSPPLRHSGHPTLFATCLYCSCCLLLSFSFFLGWGLVCPGGNAVLDQGCLWEYCVLFSSPCPRLPKPSGHGQLAAWAPSWFLRLT